MTRFHDTVKLVNMVFFYGPYGIYTEKNTLHKSRRNNFQISILISEVF